MASIVPETQSRSVVIGLRVMEEERDLLHGYAAVLGESLSDILRRKGVDEALALARKVLDRTKSEGA